MQDIGWPSKTGTGTASKWDANQGGQGRTVWKVCVKRAQSVIYFVEKWVALKRAFVSEAQSIDLLAAGVLGDGLGTLGDGVLGQLAGQEQTDGGLDFAGGDGGAAVVVGETGGLGGDALEDVVDEAVHDGHGLAGDAGVGVNLLQHLVHVDGVALLPALSALLASFAGDLGHGFLGALLGGGLGGFRHG